MNYIFCAKPDNDLVRLARTLNLTLLKNFDGMSFRLNKERFLPSKGDKVICWGSSIPDLEDVPVLNSLPAPLNSDYARVFKLYQADISSISYGDAGNDPRKAKRYLDQGWLVRREGHKSGDDLLGLNTGKMMFVCPKQNFLEEYRIHSFGGKSIKAGLKVPIKGNTIVTEAEWSPLKAGVTHPWIRTSLGGWTIEYGDFKSSGLLRKMCHASIKAVGAQFGSIDIARVGPERYMVISVSLAPSLSDEGVFNRYVLHLGRWLEGKADDKESE